MKRVLNNNKVSLPRATRRIVFVAAPGTEILDLVGPLQVFARASDMYCRANPGARPIYSAAVVSIFSGRSLMADCGLRFTAHKTFSEVRASTSTRLVCRRHA